jgi:glutathione peroxidase
VEDSEVTWNFQKYVFDEEGHLLQVFSPRTEPAEDAVLAALGLV